jgi:hypothetical protein
MCYFDSNWMGLEWTPWVSFSGSKSEWIQLPDKPGLYRIRPENGSLIVYIGETGRGLRDRVNALRRGAFSELMPFNDPHTAAPNLWVWRQEEHWNYECSVAPFTKSRLDRKAMECLLLWKYRLEKGESTLCNHGRFHKNYRKSSDRSKNRRGYRLPNPEINSSGGSSFKALEQQGKPLDLDWMGVPWSRDSLLCAESLKQLSNNPAVYKIFDAKNGVLVYIGETKKLKNRFMQHSRTYQDIGLSFSFYVLPESTKEHELHEIENDLIGAYYFQTLSVPKYQFSNTTTQLNT